MATAVLYNFKRKEPVPVIAVSHPCYPAEEDGMPGEPIDPAEFVPQDRIAQALLRAYLTRANLRSASVSMTVLDCIVAVLEKTAQRPAVA